MQNIQLYYGSRKLLSSEKIVLARIIEWLSVHHVPAVIFTNVKIRWNEIDIVVATPSTTLVIEVKGYRNPVSGRENGKWISTNSRGETKLHTNGYEQVIEAYRALKKAMDSLYGGAVTMSYPKAAIIFEGGIPEGSDLFKPVDDRVVICGIERLSELLAHRSQHPWPLESLKDLATVLRLTLNQGPASSERAKVVSPAEARCAATASEATNSEHPSRPVNTLPLALLRVQRVSREGTNTVETSLLGTTRTAVSAASPYVDVGLNTASPLRRKHRARSGVGVVVIAFMAAGAAYYANVWMSQEKLRKSERSVATPLSARKISPKSPARRHQKPEVRDSQHKLPANIPPIAMTPGASAIALPSSARPTPITCPPGVDRLGCNGRVGVLSTPICPPGFMVSGATCVLQSQ